MNKISQQIEQLMDHFEFNQINYNLISMSYPNYDSYIPMQNPHDLNKWMKAVKEIYYKEKSGINRRNSIRQATVGWKITETFDFLNWLKFYEEGAHMKYKTANQQIKTAQLWYENSNAPGYFLPIKPDPSKVEKPANTPIDFANTPTIDENAEQEKKLTIERQRQKIIGRLDSAEKLLRTQEGQMFAGKELENLLDTIYQLKKKIHMINSLSARSYRTYEDLIVQSANKMTKNGFVKAAQILHSLAQEAGEAALSPATPAPPGEGSGSVGSLPSTGPGMLPAPNEGSDAILTEKPPKGIEQFLENLDTSNITTVEDKDELEVLDNDDELMVEAQVLKEPITEPLTTDPTPDIVKSPISEPNLEVKEEDIATINKEKSDAAALDNKLDAAFSNLTVEDVVAKLDEVATIYRRRELPLRLSLIDMLLSKLGMSSLFIPFSEALSKSLESNNYILSRLEDTLSQLRGAMTSATVDLDEKPVMITPGAEEIKQNLQEKSDKEKARKQIRKDLENETLETAPKETPQVEIKEDLANPVKPPDQPINI